MKYLSLDLIFFFTGTRVSRFLILAGVAAILAGSLTSCDDADFNSFTNDELIEPMGPKPAYAPEMDDQMWAVIEQFVAFGDPPLPTLTARQARMTHSVTDVVNTLLAKNNLSAPAPAVMTDQRVLPPNYTPGSAPATIIAAEIDPLQTEGRLLADRLEAAGVTTTYQLYPGTTHEFFGTYAVVPPADGAQDFAADQLRAAFQ